MFEPTVPSSTSQKYGLTSARPNPVMAGKSVAGSAGITSIFVMPIEASVGS